MLGQETIDQLDTALSDSGMDAARKEKVLRCFGLGQKKQARMLLNGYRSELLEGMHESQDKLYLVDFIIQKWKLG